MTNSLTSRGVQPKATSDKPKPDKFVWVVCPNCEGYCRHPVFNCTHCDNTGKVKARYIRMARGSGSSKGTVKYKPGDKDWSYQVRERDHWKCRWCGKQHTPWFSEREGRLVCNTLDAAHLFRRGHGTTKLDLLNGFAMCKMTCHKYIDNAGEKDFHTWARAELGDAVYEDLEARSRQTKKRSPRKAT